MSDESWNESSQDEIDVRPHNYRASQDSWKSVDDDFPDIIQDNEDYVSTKSAGNTEHITLIQMSKDDIFTNKSLMDRIVTNLHDVAELLGISTSNASALLRNYKWNREQLTERYFENPENVLGQLVSCDQAPPPMETDECVICGDSADEVEMLSLECRHSFCTQCWKDHIEESINNGKSDNITCMQAKCPQLIVDPNWLAPIISPETMKKFITFWVNAFVEVNPVWKQCPSANCEYIVKVEGTRELRCLCGYISCPSCPLEGHEPATCSEMKQWEVKSKDDSGTFEWMKLNTQDCPKCGWPIEKNQGCNAMRCAKCNHEFCWICLGDSAAHGVKTHPNCPGDKPKSWDNEGEQSQTREGLEKYLHYYHRYKVHEQSQKFENELREKTHTGQQALASKLVSNRNIQMLGEASENLIECRRVLKHTYVKAFYMKEKNPKDLFEFLQADLEAATEKLSGLLETDKGSIHMDEIRSKSNNAAQRLIKLLDETAIDIEQPLEPVKQIQSSSLHEIDTEVTLKAKIKGERPRPAKKACCSLF